MILKKSCFFEKEKKSCFYLRPFDYDMGYLVNYECIRPFNNEVHILRVSVVAVVCVSVSPPYDHMYCVLAICPHDKSFSQLLLNRIYLECWGEIKILLRMRTNIYITDELDSYKNLIDHRKEHGN